MKRRIFKLLSDLYRKLQFPNAGIGTFISMKSEIVGGNISIGDNCRILKNAILDTSTNPGNADYLKFTKTGEIVLGDKVSVKSYALLYSYDGFIRIGNNCTLNPYTVVYGHGGVEIGNNVMIAAHCIIISANHNFDSIKDPMNQQGLSCEGISIGSDVWIGGNVKILDGVKIGNSCIVASGSVVNKDLESFGIYGGAPAKLIRKRITVN